VTSATYELPASLPVEHGRWGDTAADFQRTDALAVLDPHGAPFTFCTRPRGGRKSTDGAAYAVALHLTVAPPGSRSYLVAADAAQAGLIVDSVRSFVHRERALRKRLKIEARRVLFLDDSAGQLRRGATRRRGEFVGLAPVPRHRRRAECLAQHRGRPRSLECGGECHAESRALPPRRVDERRCARSLVLPSARTRQDVAAVAGL